MPFGYKYDTGKIAPVRWDDLSVGATATKIGANNKPDFDYTNIGLLFPQNDPLEKVYMTFQMSHKKKLGTPIRLHVHFVQTSAAKPVFRADIRFYNNGGQVVSFASIDTNGSTAFPWTTGSLLNIIMFPDVAAPAGETLSANFDVILYRTDNAVAGDVLVKYVDAHYQIDTDGSQTEYVK